MSTANDRPTVAMSPVKGTPDDLQRKFAFDAALLNARLGDHEAWRYTVIGIAIILAVAGMVIALITRF